jgi:hypothetical protein
MFDYFNMFLINCILKKIVCIYIAQLYLLKHDDHPVKSFLPFSDPFRKTPVESISIVLS